MTNETRDISTDTFEFIYDACNELFMMDEDDIEDLIIGIERYDIDDSQIPVVESLISIARMNHTYCQGVGCDVIELELQSFI